MRNGHGVRSLNAQQTRLLRLKAQQLLPADAGRATAPAGVLKQVVGVQAQDLAAALLSVRVRSAGLTAAGVERARQEERSIVWVWGMRGTLHLITAEDAKWLIPLLGPPLLAAHQRRFRELGWDEARAATGIRLVQEALLEHGRLTRAEIIRLLRKNGLPFEGQAPVHLLYQAALAGVLCIGPDQEKTSTYVLFESWLGQPQPLPRPAALAKIARRYLEAYGPAGPEDMARWSGLKLNEARQAWQLIADQLVEVEVGGQAAWLLRSQLPRLDEAFDSAPAVRLLPRFDTYLLGYANRDLVVDPAFAKRVHPGGGIIHPVLLVDGQALGTWKTRRRGGYVEVLVEPFASLEDELRPQIEGEVADVARFLGQEAVLTIL